MVHEPFFNWNLAWLALLCTHYWSAIIVEQQKQLLTRAVMAIINICTHTNKLRSIKRVKIMSKLPAAKLISCSHTHTYTHKHTFTYTYISIAFTCPSFGATLSCRKVTRSPVRPSTFIDWRAWLVARRRQLTAPRIQNFGHFNETAKVLWPLLCCIVQAMILYDFWA